MNVILTNRRTDVRVVARVTPLLRTSTSPHSRCHRAARL